MEITVQRLGRFAQVVVERGQVAGRHVLRARLARRIGKGAEYRQDLRAKPGQGSADLVRRTVAEVRAILEERERAEPTRRAAVFLVADGWLTLQQEFEDLEPAVTALAARGLGYGVHVIASAVKWSQFRPAIRDLFGTRLELRLGDPYESEAGRAAA